MTEKEFLYPPLAYRGTPFWAWNAKLEKEKLKEQIDCFKKMGMGGFCIHSRIGLDTPYLGETFMEMVKFSSAYGKEQGLCTWLYDEDKWPSGYGAGRVTKTEAYRSRYLLFSDKEYPDGDFIREKKPETRLVLSGRLRKIGDYMVRTKKGYLIDYRCCEGEEKGCSGEKAWHAYLVISGNSPWFNGQTYLDTLNQEAAAAFIKTTHEVYAAHLKEEFSKSIPAVFTDEPQFILKETLLADGETGEAGIPYTDDFEETFKKTYGLSFLEHLPRLFWEPMEENDYSFRWKYHDHIAQRFLSGYLDTVGQWCKENNLSLTGHVMNEPTLQEQTRAVGEVMRCYKSFQIPGIDMLARRTEYTTAKQAKSAANQKGIEGITSELYGVTNWDFDFRGYKSVGDWQAALGVVNRVHHLTWYSMGGESKRDYPPSIGAQSPWHKEFHRIEDYFARIRMVLKQGKPAVRIGVLHPIESYWMRYGCEGVTLDRREELEEKFQTLIRWLLFGKLDFDYIAESTLPDLYREAKGKFCVGEMGYDVILVAGLDTMRSSTLEFLKKWKDRGGAVIFMGAPPQYTDAVKEPAVREFAECCQCIGWERTCLYDALERYREVAVTDEQGNSDKGLIYRMCEKEEKRYLFLAPGNPKEQYGLPREETVQVWIKGRWQVQLWDAKTGESAFVPAIYEKKEEAEKTAIWTCLKWRRFEQDSLLLEMTAAKEEEEDRARQTLPVKRKLLLRKLLSAPQKVFTEEENVLLLDRAEYRLDEGEWMPCEEILKADDGIREKLNYPLRTESQIQPWLQGEIRPEHYVTLRFEILSEVEESVMLAAEGKIRHLQLNGDRAETKSEGWYVDKCIKKYKVGILSKGENILEIGLEYGEKENLEWCYLLGKFGVSLSGDRAVLKSPNPVRYGDYSIQGLPFYGGNLWLEMEEELPGGDVEIEIPHYSAPLLKVELDGQEDMIIEAPYRAVFSCVKAGRHKIRICCYGNRFNTFGQLHNCDPEEVYFGPKTWRTSGSAWCPQYRIRPVGILTTPVIYVYTQESERKAKEKLVCEDS